MIKKYISALGDKIDCINRLTHMKINRVVYHVILFLQRLMILMFSNTVYLQNVNIIYKKVVTSSIYKNFVRLKYILPRDEDLK